LPWFKALSENKDQMSTLTRPPVECELHHPTLSVRDVGAAAEYYATKLGFTLAFSEGDPPTFAGVNLDCVQIFLSAGTPEPAGCSV
jgi:catechol 2,3-dioxygenase-like lactoylglutathione lyase family enzyme